MSKFKDYYHILGIPNNASNDEIKKAYRKKAATSHPDAGGDPKKFIEITEAYNVLKDPEIKKKYDIAYIDHLNRKRFNDNFYSNVSKEKSSHYEDEEETYQTFHRTSGDLRNKIIIIVFILFVIAILYVSFRPFIPETSNKESVSYEIIKEKKPVSGEGITHGTTQGEVLEIMGKPTETQRNLWKYGNSSIYFNYEGKVDGWYDDGNLKIKR